eukprot:138200-Lingulodinium_polyedra.AAC.1
MVTLHELDNGILTPGALKGVRERGGILLEVTLTIEAESVYKPITSRDLIPPTEKNLLGHLSWIRELLDVGVLQS